LRIGGDAAHPVSVFRFPRAHRSTEQGNQVDPVAGMRFTDVVEQSQGIATPADEGGHCLGVVELDLGKVSPKCFGLC
jgi:hypothetical protein